MPPPLYPGGTQYHRDDTRHCPHDQDGPAGNSPPALLYFQCGLGLLRAQYMQDEQHLHPDAHRPLGTRIRPSDTVRYRSFSTLSLNTASTCRYCGARGKRILPRMAPLPSDVDEITKTRTFHNPQLLCWCPLTSLSPTLPPSYAFYPCVHDMLSGFHSSVVCLVFIEYNILSVVPSEPPWS